MLGFSHDRAVRQRRSGSADDRREGGQTVYLPTGFAERGEDYEIGRFRELLREA
jgi:hypothetical protein